MKPNSNENPRINLPTPVGEIPLPKLGSPEAQYFTQELGAKVAENKQPLFTPQMAQMPQSIPNPIVPSLRGVVGKSTDDVVSITADDGDLIEKEWVNKAKRIIEANREDPRSQSTELTLVKSDYLKQRYNKTIKLSEE